MTSVETSPPQRSTKTRRREAWQIDILEAFYRHVSMVSCAFVLSTLTLVLKKHMPDKAEKEMLAARINDTLKYVNIWFQVGPPRLLFPTCAMLTGCNLVQNRRQAAQKKGELRPRETYENWRNKRQGHSGMEYDEFPTPPEYSTSAASSSYFGQSYASQDMMLATPREMEEHRPPSVSSSMVASPPACQPAQSPFAFGLSAPLKTYDGSNPLPIPSDRSRPSYPPSRSYERPTYTPPYSAEGHSVASHPPPTYPVEYTRPEIARSISMRREAPGPSLSGFHLEEGRSSLLLPSLSGLESSSTFGKMPSPSTLLPRRESGGSNNEYSLSSARTEEMSPPSHLKLPPISSLALPDNDTWFSAIAARRS
ncbi:hypothetical protein QFC19_001256 [Naganishia cerealis]|uniref:Uncharacterized protein n=1 Tax=Naganishia cerealis TaxID=610337 RepID=A0ACC2WHV9_9TREE|nr:hypothetical protein QFC19_001256 [Naganishia cerealis]